MLFARTKNLTNISTIYLSVIYQSINLSIHCRLEEECPGSKKLKIRLQSEVNLITFNSSQFPGSSLHCHLGHRHIHPDTTQQSPLEGKNTVAIKLFGLVDVTCVSELSVPSTQYGLAVFIEELPH